MTLLRFNKKNPVRNNRSDSVTKRVEGEWSEDVRSNKQWVFFPQSLSRSSPFNRGVWLRVACSSHFVSHGGQQVLAVHLDFFSNCFYLSLMLVVVFILERFRFGKHVFLTLLESPSMVRTSLPSCGRFFSEDVAQVMQHVCSM